MGAATWVIAAALAQGAVTKAHAAEAAKTDGASMIDELIVTSRKREESILDVPISITAVTAETLERKSVRDLEELSRSVPGMVVAVNGDTEPKFFSLRGVGPGGTFAAATVAVYVDDTPITIGPVSSDLKIFDVDRIEVLRGPQGTLFGSSAMGGAIRYVSPKLGYDGVSGKLKAEVGTTAHGGESYEVQGAAGGPLAGVLGFRASGFYRHDGGYIDVVNEATGAITKKDVNSGDAYGGRLALGAKFENVEVVASMLFQDTRQDDINVFHSVRSSGGVVTPLGPLQKTERVDIWTKDKFWEPNLLVNVDLGFAELTSSTSLQRQRLSKQTDGSYFIGAVFGLPPALSDAVVSPNFQNVRLDAVTQEVRLASNPGGKLDWLVGGYYRRSKLDLASGFGSNFIDLGFPPALFFPGGGIQAATLVSEVHEAAAFGEVSWHVTEALKLTGGLRYTSLSREQGGGQEFAPLVTGGAPPPPPFIPPKSKEHPLTPKFSAAYDVTDDVMVYATAAKGFREGGANNPVFIVDPTNPADPCRARLTELGLFPAPGTFASDKLWSYELGAKGQTADRRLRFQGAIYQINWKDIQQEVNLIAGCGTNTIANFGEARVRGLEGEVSWRPMPGLSLDFNANLSEAELTKNEPGIANAGTPLAHAPKFTGGAAAQYEWALSNDWNAYLRGEIQHIGPSNRFIEDLTSTNAGLRAKGYEVVSLRAAVSKDDYELSLFANNLFDAQPIIFDRPGALAPGGGQGSGRSTLRPRTIGVSLAKTF